MFSVVIPAYNAEKFLHIAVDSVLQQTCPDFEIIIVDDGSEDNTRQVASQMQDQRIKYIYRENGGVSEARNTGIRNASGDFVCFLDADDQWYPNHLEVLSKMMEAYPDCPVLCTGYEIRLTTGESIPHSGNLLKSVKEKDFRTENGYEQIRKYGYLITTNCVCCRRDLFQDVGYFEPGIKNGEDDDMWYRLLAYYPVAFSKEMTTIYNRENSRATAKTNLVNDWVFLKRVEEIMASPRVTQERKNALRMLLEQKKLSRIRKAILAGQKRGAFKNLLKLKLRLVSRKKYAQTWLALLAPKKMLRKIAEKRERGFFTQH